MNCEVQKKFSCYPEHVAKALLNIRTLIVTTAGELGIDDLQETLKWGEPSYIAKTGSTIRFDWKEKSPQQFGIYFNCKTTLIETFKEVYGDTFIYEGNRALIFSLNQPVAMKELAHCISLALQYKRIKHLNLLGV